ncbi:site-specific integrase, partial [bacterium]
MAILIRCECKAEAKLTAKTCPGCGMEFPRKGRLYKVVLRMGGRKVTRTIGNLEAAREIEAKLKVDIAKEEHNLQKKTPAPTLAQIWKRYLPWAMENKSSWEMDVYSYQRHLEPIFGSMRMDQISQFDVE